MILVASFAEVLANQWVTFFPMRFSLPSANPLQNHSPRQVVTTNPAPISRWRRTLPVRSAMPPLRDMSAQNRIPRPDHPLVRHPFAETRLLKL